MIKKLKKRQIEEVAEFYEQEMSDKFIDIQEKPITKLQYIRILEENLDKSEMFVIYKNKLKGFIWFVKNKNEINLEEIFTTEKNKGYGKALLNFLIDFAKRNKIKKINLDVHIKNLDAINFFKKFGFTERTLEMSLDLN